jgi:hypothetical protein
MTQIELDVLLEKAQRITMSPGDREAQRRSFAYGNANIENEAVTRRVIDEVANRLAAEPTLDNLLPQDDANAGRAGSK